MSATEAARVIHRGGTIAYPTEGVFGLGCLPHHEDAVQRILDIKQRSAAKGLILIAACAEDLDGWVADSVQSEIPHPDPDQPTTWICTAGERVPAIVQGDNEGIAVRITTHPIAAAICAAARSPVVSTSANLSGEATVADTSELQRKFASLVDYVVPGECGPAEAPSVIRVLATGDTLRGT